MRQVRVGGRLTESLHRTQGLYEPWPRCARSAGKRGVSCTASSTQERKVTL